MSKYAIAIDGPSGSGKSTVARILAEKYGLIHVDTGAMFRAVALFCLQQGIDADQEDEVVQQLEKIKIQLIYQKEGQSVFLNNENVTKAIRGQDVAKGASQVARYLPVREKLLDMQREIAKSNPVIMDGRDIGTCVLPDADLKVYLVASVDERAKRRIKELAELNKPGNLDEIKKEIQERDENDMNRKHAPLQKAEDAVLIDTSGMPLAEVVAKIQALISLPVSDK